MLGICAAAPYIGPIIQQKAMSDWSKVYHTDNQIRATLVKDVLEGNGIPSVIINKRDSQYNNFGDIEVYVGAPQVLKAIKIIRDEIQFDETA
jgi:hypothetical protein